MKIKRIKVTNLSVSLAQDGETFMPSKRSIFLARTLCHLNLKGKTVIDLGCGSGFLAIISGLLGAKEVLVLDISPLAIVATRKNWEKNGLKTKLITKISNCFEAINKPDWFGHFDFIISNPPGLPLSVLNNLENHEFSSWMWNGAGDDGRQVVDSILKEGPKFLKTRGAIVISHSSRLDFAKTRKMARNLNEVSLSERKFLLEPHFLKFLSFWKNKKGLVFEKDGRIFERIRILQFAKKIG